MIPSMALIDEAKSLRDKAKCEARQALLDLPEMRQLVEFVESVRRENGGVRVPHFDPLDGGVEAQCLFLLEAPGPQAVCSGFVSRNNPDETAKNWFKLNVDAGIDRRRTIIWNIVPWYIGKDERIRPATDADIQRGLPYLRRLLTMLKSLRLVVLVGKKAGKARPSIQAWTNNIEICDLKHPSPMFVNRRTGNRELILQGLHEVRRRLDEQARTKVRSDPTTM
jgi:uracil-DNA glycosylase